jgi:hypothetical protein
MSAGRVLVKYLGLLANFTFTFRTRNTFWNTNCFQFGVALVGCNAVRTCRQTPKFEGTYCLHLQRWNECYEVGRLYGVRRRIRPGELANESHGIRREDKAAKLRNIPENSIIFPHITVKLSNPTSSFVWSVRVLVSGCRHTGCVLKCQQS